MENTVNIRDISSEALEGVETELSSNLRRIEELQALFSRPVTTHQIGQEIIEQANWLLADIAASLDIAGGTLTE